jgi:hypothetical protein
MLALAGRLLSGLTVSPMTAVISVARHDEDDGVIRDDDVDRRIGPVRDRLIFMVARWCAR